MRDKSNVFPYINSSQRQQVISCKFFDNMYFLWLSLVCNISETTLSSAQVWKIN